MGTLLSWECGSSITAKCKLREVMGHGQANMKYFLFRHPSALSIPNEGAPGQALHGWLPETKATRGRKLPTLLVYEVPMSYKPEFRETRSSGTVPDHLNLRLTKHPLQSPNPCDQTEEHYLLLTATNAGPRISDRNAASKWGNPLN